MSQTPTRECLPPNGLCPGDKLFCWDFDASGLFGAAHVDPPVDERGGRPALAAQYLLASRFVIRVGGGRGDHQFAGIGQDDQPVADQDTLTGAETPAETT